MTKDDGGPAFPTVVSAPLLDSGMSLRDYFAAQVLSAAIVNWDSMASLAKQCYAIADAMLKERAK